jgi:hypothetical protein
MSFCLYTTITLLGISSYAVGIWKMLKNKYKPSTFSRIIWVLLSINSFAGVFLSHSSSSSILLGGIGLLGNIGMCFVSLFKGTREIGKLEYFCSIMLMFSVIVWMTLDAPLINLAISLFAHFIGAVPTYKKVWNHPESEDISFWFLFFLASALSIFVSNTFSLRTIILPVYFMLFDGSILLLALRKFDLMGYEKFKLILTRHKKKIRFS